MSEPSSAGADTAQPLGMPAKDFTSHQLREARAQAVSLASKNERLVAALGTARERITELGQQLDAVTRPRSPWDCSPQFPAHRTSPTPVTASGPETTPLGSARSP